MSSSFVSLLHSHALACASDIVQDPNHLLSPLLVDHLNLLSGGTLSQHKAATSHFRWPTDRLLLYVFTERSQLLHNRISLGAPTKALFMRKAWLRAAAASHPLHRVVAIWIEPEIGATSAAYVGITTHTCYLLPLTLPQSPLALKSTRYADATHALVPGQYIDHSNDTLMAELSHRALHVRSATPLVAPSLSIQTLRCKLERALAKDDLFEWFHARQIAMLQSDGRLHPILHGDEDASFALILFCVVARCVYGSDAKSTLRTRALNCFLNFESRRFSVQLFQRCGTLEATLLLLQNDPAVRTIAQRGFSIGTFSRSEVDAAVVSALEDSCVYYVRADHNVERIFSYDSALALVQNMTARRGVLHRGKLFFTYHDVPHVLSELYSLVLEKFALTTADFFRGEMPSFMLSHPRKAEYFQAAFQMARERFLKVQGRHVQSSAGRAAVVLPDLEDLIGQAAPLCLVNSMEYLRHSGRLPHLSRALGYRHLLDTGYSVNDVETIARKHVTGDGTLKDHINTIQFEDKNLEKDRDRKCGCGLMFSARFDRDPDSRGCPFNEQTEEDLCALLISSGLDATDPMLPKIINKALGYGDVAGQRHPRAACAMHGSARIRAAIGPQPIPQDRTGGLPFESPAGYVHHVLSTVQRTPNMGEGVE